MLSGAVPALNGIKGTATMANTVRTHLTKLLESKKLRENYLAVFVCVALVVATSVALLVKRYGLAASHQETVLDCHYDGNAAHTHNADCYDADGNLVCPLPERELHIHDDSCFTEQTTLVCGLEEGEEHVHTSECYQTERILSCGKEEVTEEHVHGPGCFTTITVNDGEEPVAAVLYPEQSFNHEFKNEHGGVELRVDVHAPEGALPEGTTMRATMVDPNSLNKQERKAVDNAIAEKTDGVALEMQAVDITFLDAQGNEIEPKQNVTVTFTSPLVDTQDQTLVVHVEDEKEMQARGADAPKGNVVDTLSDRELSQRSMNLSDNQLAIDSSKFSMYLLATVSREQTMTVEGEGVSVTVDAPADAGIAANAELRITEVKKNSDEWASCEQEALEALGTNEVSDAQFFSLEIVSGGQQVQPSNDVQVTMTLNKNDNGKETKVVQLGSDPQVVDASANADTVSFTASDVASYGIVETTIEKSVLASDGKNYKVSVTYGADAGIPENADLSVEEIVKGTSSYDEYVASTESALGMEEGSAEYIRLFDIKIVDKSDSEVQYQPKDGSTVDVKIELADAKNEGGLSVVHFGNEPEIVKANVSDGKVRFKADGFSVYAVVGDGSTEQEARAAVNFYGKDTDTPLATVYVKNSDSHAELEDIVFDPGCGELSAANKELFDGWVISTVNTTDGKSYTIDTEGKTIEEIRSYLETLEISEGTVVNIYAKIVRTITIQYQGEDENTVLGSHIVKVLASDGPETTAEHTISMNYTPKTATQAFMGWNVLSGATNITSATYEGESATAPYSNGTVITVNGDVTLSVNAPTGHWLVFDENGKNATYNAPQFIEDGDVTREPAGQMTRLGYSFGGWYTDKDCTAGNEFTFGQELNDNITVYAKWTPAQTANYTVIVWKERMTDTYAENGGTGEGKQKNYDFAESYTFTGNAGSIANAVSNGTSFVVDGDPNSTRYYNARIRGRKPDNSNVDTTISYTGYHCAGYDTDVTITPEGNSVINVYYDRNTVTYTFYTYGSSTDEGTWWLCKENGDQIIASGQSAANSRIAVRDGNEYSQYTGRVSHDDGRSYYYSTTGACGGTYMREATWTFVKSSQDQWNVYQASTGLYGEKLNWPTDTGIWWYEKHNATTAYGTRMTYKDAFLPTDSDMTVEYWGNTASVGGTIHFWTQDVEGGGSYTDKVQVAAGNASFSINDKFTGFYAYQYKADNGTWQYVGSLDEEAGIYGSPVSFNSNLDIRYNRIKASITFMDGSYYDGNGNRLNETPQAEEFNTSPEYYYESDVSSYNMGGANYYTPPSKDGYTFAGWYADDACTVPYTFNTMPATGITVYAKWIQNQYRVFLHSNVPESDTTLHWGSEDQDMNFRVSTGGKVSVPTGERTGYKFIGWYFDEACTKVFDADRYVLNDTTVTTPYDKTVDMTDVMNKYGNIEGVGTNADMTGYNGGERFWITRKLDLYAKWRQELVGAEGIGVKYDANGGTNAPTDTTLYLDNTDTVAQGAPTPPDDTQQFLHWVLQKWDDEAGKYVDIPGDENFVYPGETYTVLKANARTEELEGSTEENPKYRYTVQLRAEYGPKDAPTPTHLIWYANGGISPDGTTDRYEDPALQINEAVEIKPSTTFKRNGYEFLGWARVDSTVEGYELDEKDLTEDDLFLNYEDGNFYAHVPTTSEGWTEVEKVAADERMPYHDLYAVWKKKTYTVTVIKTVDGITGDDEIPFTFTPQFEGMEGSEYRSPFQLVGKAGGADIESGGETIHYDHVKEFIEVPYETSFKITETVNDAFAVSGSYTVTNADKPEDNKTVSGITNGQEIIAKGDVQLTVTNTRKVQQLRITKTDLDKNPLGGAVFTVNVGGTDYTLTSDAEDGVLKSELFPDGMLTVPQGTYSLTEVTPPAGYNPLSAPVTIVSDETGIHATPYDVQPPTEEEEFYKLTIPNNPGAVLPNTGGIGVGAIYVAGLAFILCAGRLLLRKE